MKMEQLVAQQREFFNSGETRSVAFRRNALRKLQQELEQHADLLYDAMKQDMNKCEDEVYMTELGLVADEIRYHLSHLAGWCKEKRVKTPLAQFSAKSFVSPEPYGVALIISPWNYPILLSLEPLIGAISAGCCAVVKSSAYAPATSLALGTIIANIFEENYVAVIQGGREENQALLSQRFDYIFFTGSVAVGHVVMEAAAKFLTPVTLELGGKSPVIVDRTADIKLAAKRIMFGKVLNAGQTCVAPDYLLIHKEVKDAFVSECRHVLQQFFPDGNQDGMNVIISDKHFMRVQRLLESGKVVVGGKTDKSRRFIEPTILDEVTREDPVMQEEIFGPILPMITYEDISECISWIRQNEKPLALYLFTKDKSLEQEILKNCSFGGGCINDTVIHLATSNMGFGGVGGSGMGSYHGKLSFDTFTHYRSIVKKANWIDLPIRYRPYTNGKRKLLHFFLR